MLSTTTRTFLHYARTVDTTILVALNAVAADQAAPIDQTYEPVLFFLDYIANHPAAILILSRSSMVLAIHINASYSIKSKARSRADRHFYISDDNEDPPSNGPVHNVAQIIRNVITSAAVAEIGALFINAWQAIPAR